MRICIIGGGVVGLNIAYELSCGTASSADHDEIYLFEHEPFLGHHASTRNSEVIHAGLSYPPNSLKSRFCIEGNRWTYELLESLEVPHNRCGKWIVAADAQELAALEKMVDNARCCGAVDVHLTTVQEAQAAENSLQNIVGAAFSPHSGIMDTAAYIRALDVALSNREDVSLVYPCEVTGIDEGLIETSRGEMDCDVVINAGGLYADEIYALSGGQRDWKIVPYKGEYFILKGSDVRSMIYPVPKRFLEGVDDPVMASNFGIHVHRAISGEVFVGPSQLRLSPDQKVDYSISSSPGDFAEAIGPYIKGVNEDCLSPYQAGNRAKLFENGEPVADFQIFREGNIIHLLGIESPGLTAAPAIARYVVNTLDLVQNVSK